MNRIDPRTRFAAFLLFVALLASLFVAVERGKIERQTRRVEIAMDYNDFLALSHAYNYNPNAFLVQLRRAGLTSLALTEELGSSLAGSTSKSAYAISGLSLLDSARVSPLANPTLANLVNSGKVREGSVYLLVYDKATFDRYMQQLPLHFEPSGIQVLHTGAPWVIGVRTQIDYFDTTGLGIPTDQIQLAKRLHLFVIPRFQNDERLQDGQIARMFDDVHAGNRISTVIFFGLRNQVLGFPDHVKDTADLFKARKFMNYGEIETYDASQVQKGNLELAKLIPGRTVRVQAISKTELDKLTVPEIVSRYELGVRERNVRVVYLRPFAHEYNKMSIEQTNIEMVRDIANTIKDNGFKLGRATPIPLYRGNSAILVGLAMLAAPSLFVLLLGWYGWYRPLWAVLAYAATAGIYLGGYFTHHDILGRSIVALIAALLFATAAFTSLSGAFLEENAATAGKQLLRSLRWTAIATIVAMLGALTVVGIMSSPLLMEEVEAFRGVKLVLALPPIIALALYLFTDRFGSRVRNAREAFNEPIRIYQLILACVVIGVGTLVLMRSGNTSDVAPSSLELSLRHHLTALLSVRPRFKEFVIGFPLLMLAPALRSTDRRAAGILLSLGIGIGLGDVIDTFCHLHTPLEISILRVVFGLIIGAIIGGIGIVLYYALDRRRRQVSLVTDATPPELIEV